MNNIPQNTSSDLHDSPVEPNKDAFSNYSQAAAPFGQRDISDREKKYLKKTLQEDLPSRVISRRPGPGGRHVEYLDGATAIMLTNQVFGPLKWSTEIKSLERDFCEKDDRGRWSLCYTCILRVTHVTGAFREECGCGVATAGRPWEAMDKAKKTAITDALKRALRLFGNILGNGMGDKGGDRARRETVRRIEQNQSQSNFFEEANEVESEGEPLFAQDKTFVAKALSAGGGLGAPTLIGETKEGPPPPTLRGMPTIMRAPSSGSLTIPPESDQSTTKIVTPPTERDGVKSVTTGPPTLVNGGDQGTDAGTSFMGRPSTMPLKTVPGLPMQQGHVQQQNAPSMGLPM